MRGSDGVHRPEPALRPVLAVALSMLLAGGLGLALGGVLPVPSLHLPSWPDRAAGGEAFSAVDPNGGVWLGRSEPTRVDAADVGIHAPLTGLGVGREGEFEVPPLFQPHLAGWFEGAATPGEYGPTVLLGHVDSDWSGPAVFFPLRDLGEGDRIEVTREDETVVVFEVADIVSHPKDDLPYEAIFGLSSVPTLRLITCGGSFDRDSGDYTENLVVYADYVGHREATEADLDRPLNDREDFRRRR